VFGFKDYNVFKQEDAMYTEGFAAKFDSTEFPGRTFTVYFSCPRLCAPQTQETISRAALGENLTVSFADANVCSQFVSPDAGSLLERELRRLVRASEAVVAK